MAPDRGSEDDEDSSQSRPLIEESGRHTSMEEELQQEEHNGSARQSNVLQQRKATQKYINAHASEPQNFTLRSIIVGLLVGVVILFSNMYFGLQTGWISGMSMPAALIGFAWFKLVARYIAYPFTPVENVLVQTVAGSVGTMPLGCGFVGVIPALNFLLKKEENGPLELSMGKLMLWAVGVCFFGVAFAVPLRREVIIRERLKFPSGTATALVIGVLHGEKEENPNLKKDIDADARDDGQERQGLMDEQEREALNETTVMGEHGEDGSKRDVRSDWKARIRTLVIAFAISGFYVGTVNLPIVYTATLISSRPSSPTSSHSSETCPSSAFLWHGIGYGR